jgi:hypothetical protein
MALTLPNTTAPAPLAFDHVVLSVPYGAPSLSVAVAFKFTITTGKVTGDTGVMVTCGAMSPTCVTVKVWPAILTVPVLALLEPLGATTYVTVPELTPLPPLKIVNHATFGVAVHGHGLVVITLTVLVPAFAEKLAPLLLSA